MLKILPDWEFLRCFTEVHFGMLELFAQCIWVCNLVRWSIAVGQNRFSRSPTNILVDKLDCLGYPASLLVAPQFVHLKKVIVEWMVSSAASTFQVSLSVWPHVWQTTWIVGSCLSDAAFLSITAISTDLPQCMFIFCFVSSCSSGFWYLHFGHLSEGVPFLTTWSNAPHCGQKFIVVTFMEAFLITMIFISCDFHVTNNLINVPFGAFHNFNEFHKQLIINSPKSQTMKLQSLFLAG